MSPTGSVGLISQWGGALSAGAAPALEVAPAALLGGPLEGGPAPSRGDRPRAVPLLVVQLRHRIILPRSVVGVMPILTHGEPGWLHRAAAVSLPDSHGRSSRRASGAASCREPARCPAGAARGDRQRAVARSERRPARLGLVRWESGNTPLEGSSGRRLPCQIHMKEARGAHSRPLRAAKLPDVRWQQQVATFTGLRTARSAAWPASGSCGGNPAM